MRAYIKKLQSKEEHIRKQILVGLMIFSMVIVGSIWIYNLTGRFDAKVASQASADMKPFALLGSSIGDALKNISASVGNISFSKKTGNADGKQIDLNVIKDPNQ
ncbi:MAG TPA: hypothetical protein VMR49_00665 [Candidatus Paceibacterota bacterium]|jgi:hypothetical protein|nr:hypothetical protein [Candidatus Paceibacterota bacterium]